MRVWLSSKIQITYYLVVLKYNVFIGNINLLSKFYFGLQKPISRVSSILALKFGSFAFSARILWQQDLPDVSSLQHPEGHDQGCHPPSRLHGAQTRVQVRPRLLFKWYFYNKTVKLQVRERNKKFCMIL
jgi:hypothetical protein